MAMLNNQRVYIYIYYILYIFLYGSVWKWTIPPMLLVLSKTRWVTSGFRDTRFFSDKSAYRYDGYVTNDDLVGGFKDIIYIYLYVQTVKNGMTIQTLEHLVQGVETTNQSEQWRFRSKDYWLVRNHDRWSAKTAAFPRPFGVSLGRWVSAIPTSHQGNCGLSWRPIDWTNSMERLCTSPLSSLIKRSCTSFEPHTLDGRRQGRGTKDGAILLGQPN